MDDLKDRFAQDLKLLGDTLPAGVVRAIFCIAFGQDGPAQVVYVDPEDREALVICINEELTRMFGSPHQVVSLEKLQRFCHKHHISESALLEFKASEDRLTE